MRRLIARELRLAREQNSAGERFARHRHLWHGRRAERGDCGGGTGWKRQGRQIGKEVAANPQARQFRRLR